MGKHRMEADHPPTGRLHVSELTGTTDGARERTPGSRRGRSGLPARNKLMAAVVATGAFAAIGQPFAHAAGGSAEGVERQAHEQQAQAEPQHQLQDAVTGNRYGPGSVRLLALQQPTDGNFELQRLVKSKAVQQERERAAAERRARAEAERKARAEAERRAEQQRQAEAERQAAEEQAAEQSSAEFVKPTEGELTSTYGMRGGSMHNGIDLANSIGTPIHSVAAGEVINAGPASGFGQWVRVQHDDGTITVYGHVASFTVSVGERVEAGQQIATMGNEGQSTGPHLHFEVIEDGTKIDPLPWLEERGITV
ncbi:M23 family metallopeptidase [Salinifilum ghardaiensis]